MMKEEQLRVALGRLRACWHRTRGVRMASKVTLGRRVRMDYPSGIEMGERVTLEDDVWFKLVNRQASVSVGAFTFIGRGTEIDVSQSVTIGDHSLIGPGVFITDHNHNIAADSRILDQGCGAAAVIIGCDVWLGARVIVLPGVIIGNGAVIGAGAVVTQSIPANTINVGIPARTLRMRGTC